jgi:hypothetical protein
LIHKHHIIPKHMGGTDNLDNLVEVTVEQHADLHKQLWEDLGHWEDELAWKVLSGQIYHQEATLEAIRHVQIGRKKSNEEIAKLKLAWEIRKQDPSWVSSMRGKKHSESTRKKMSIARQGRTPNLGKKHSDEAKYKMRTSLRTCCVCNKTMNSGNFVKYKHGENCKQIRST